MCLGKKNCTCNKSLELQVQLSIQISRCIYSCFTSEQMLLNVFSCVFKAFNRDADGISLVPPTHRHHNDHRPKAPPHTHTPIFPSWPPQRQLSLPSTLSFLTECSLDTYPPPFLLNGCGWDGVKVITGPWIFVPTHFISVRLPTGKSMSSALMKDLHLCPMDLLVFIFSPNMVSMRSLDTMAHISYSMWHCRTSAHSHFLIVEGRLFTSHAECANFHHIQIGSLDHTSSSRVIFIGNQAEQVSTSRLHYTHAITVLNVLCQ